MSDFDPTSIAADCGGAWQGNPGHAIAGFSIDTRSLQPGELFVALKTGQRDGHDFVRDAADRGAAGALVSRVVADVSLPQLLVGDTVDALQSLAKAHRSRFGGRVVGVTGSAGKTSTKDLLAAILADPEEILATAGNLNNHLGVPLTMLRLDVQQHRFAVIEAGISGTGEMAVIAPLIAPDVAIITAIGAAHLEGLESVSGVAREKAILAAAVPAAGTVVLGSSCLRFPEFRELVSRRLIVAGAGEKGIKPGMREQMVPFAIQHENDNTQVCLTWHGAVEEFSVPRTTSGMAGNLALAVATALNLGVKSGSIRERLPGWRPAPLRGEIRRDRGRLIYLDCYNANPVSMRDAIDGFVDLAPESQPRLFVFGSMEELGAEAERLHRELGEYLPMRSQDSLIVFGTNAAALAEGVGSRSLNAAISINPDFSDAERVVRVFRGAVFLKGSRRYALEKLVGPVSMTEAAATKGVAA